jgi:hypothetical protein
MAPSDLGEAMRLRGLLMNALGGLPHLLGKIANFLQHAPLR